MRKVIGVAALLGAVAFAGPVNAASQPAVPERTIVAGLLSHTTIHRSGPWPPTAS